jgi:hypothetical protein
MQLLSSLLLLGGAPFLADHGPALLSAAAGLVGEVVERGHLLLLPPVDLLLVAAPQQAAPLLLPFMQVRARGGRGGGGRGGGALRGCLAWRACVWARPRPQRGAAHSALHPRKPHTSGAARPT